MKSMIPMTFGLALLVSGSAAAFPVAPAVDVAARELLYTAQNFDNAVDTNGYGNSDIGADTETLIDAAEHFVEEVELGPQDLDVDFAAITQTFDEIRNHVTASPYLLGSPALRTAWFQVEEANISLRQAWYAGSVPVGRTVTCYSANVSGQQFNGSAPDVNTAQQLALRACEMTWGSAGCRIESCQ